jgi:hypothetical protein
VAVDAVLGPRQGLEALRGYRLAARLAKPERPCLDAPQRSFDLGEVVLFSLAELLAALALGHFRGGGGLRAVRNPRVFDFLGEFDPYSLALGFERSP